MSDQTIIRETLVQDRQGLEALYKSAFPDEDLWPVVSQLINTGEDCLNLTAASAKQVVGHIAFSRCHVPPSDAHLTLLGPLAVLPAHQRSGIGAALVDAGFQKLEEVNAQKVLVLGDPDYYSRFGFAAETKIEPPYPIPEAWKPAWQSLDLEKARGEAGGILVVPAPWQHPELWSA